MDYSRLTDAELLGKLMGVKEARRLYAGSLSSLFAANGEATKGRQLCIIARELVTTERS